jgi:hypothetical protein
MCFLADELAKMVGVEPAAYLREATHRALHQPGTVTLPTLDALLPQNIDPDTLSIDGAETCFAERLH